MLKIEAFGVLSSSVNDEPDPKVEAEVVLGVGLKDESGAKADW